MTTRTQSTSRAAALTLTAIAAIAFLSGACGSDDDAAANPTAGATIAATEPASTTTSATDTTPPTAATPAAPGGATISTADAGALGTILTTADGLTLYTFKNDVAGDGKSACEGGCAAAWPALIDGEPTAGEGVTGELGTITRADGAKQVTYNGMPLYRFVNDAVPGETNGQNVGSVWFVAQP